MNTIKIIFLWSSIPFGFLIFNFTLSKLTNKVSPSIDINNYINEINLKLINCDFYKNVLNPTTKKFLNENRLELKPLSEEKNYIIERFINHIINNPVNIAFNSFTFTIIWKIYCSTRFKYYFKYTNSLTNSHKLSKIKTVKYSSKFILSLNKRLRIIFKFLYNI